MKPIPLLLVLLLLLPAAAQAQTRAAGTIRAGETVSARLAPPDSAARAPVDEWAFTHRATEQVTIRVESAEFAPTLDFGRVQDGAFRPESWLVHTGLGYAMAYRFPRAGLPHVVRVGPDSAGRGGAYTLRVIAGAPSRPVRVGERVAGVLDGQDPSTSDGALYHSYSHDDYVVTPATGDSLTVVVEAEDYTPRVAVGTTRGALFQKEAEARGTRGGPAVLTFRPRPGRAYVLRVGGTNPYAGTGGFGPYTLRID